MNKKPTDLAQGLASPVEETDTRDSGQASGHTAALGVENKDTPCPWFERTGKWLALWHADRAQHEAGRHRFIE